jgi:L-ectoine synthase
MIIRKRADIEQTDRFVHWGNGTTHRFLVESDGMGFTLCHTIVFAGTSTELKYENHLEACYCIQGAGWVSSGGKTHRIEPGTLYALDQHDEHVLTADDAGDLVLVSVFNPPLTGTESHDPNAQGPSGY